MAGITPSQTVGPFFAYGLTPSGKYDWSDLIGSNLVTPDVAGERIRIEGRVTDADGKPINDALLEIWQADGEGRYQFLTVKPGAYPWGNHDNAWRPAHIHLSLFGHSFLSRLVTQMYFPGDPLIPYDPIYRSIPEGSRERLMSSFDLDATVPNWALGYRFDIVLRGREQTPMGL